MTRLSTPIGLVLIGSILLGACGTASPGPLTWIDRPLDETKAPLEPLTIMAHASDGDGISGFEFFVDGRSIRTVEIQGGRLEVLSYEWSPPSSGRYLIGVRAIDSNGINGPMATSHITIGGPVATVTQDQATPIPGSTARIVTITPSQTPSTPTLTPTLTPTWTPTKTMLIPSVTPSRTHTSPPPDTTPPGIFGAVINPGEIYTSGPGCPSQPRTAESIVVAVDDSGIARIYGNWSIYADGVLVGSGVVDYILVNPTYNAYQGIYGPVDQDGTMEIRGTVLDKSGNSSLFSHTVTVRACIL